ncbi:MAG: aminotransferase class III-fold pyridoxal phosphate-dependent enzyme, partial [Nitratireductor sp.]
IGVLGHGYTGSGHPVAAAVALENLKIIEERDLVGHVKAVAPVFQKRLAELAENPLVVETRGIGLIGAAELSHAALAETPGALGVRTNAEFQDRGLISRNMLDAMAFCPPLIITEAQVNEMFDIARAGLDAVAESL